MCGSLNPAAERACVVCTLERVDDDAMAPLPVAVPGGGASATATATAAAQWACHICSFENSARDPLCMICGTARAAASSAV
jgi:hypothetical protein